MTLSLNTLCELFGNHYGYNFSLLNTKIIDITKVIILVEDGFLSPLEIHNLLIK